VHLGALLQLSQRPAGCHARLIDAARGHHRVTKGRRDGSKGRASERQQRRVIGDCWRVGAVNVLALRSQAGLARKQAAKVLKDTADRHAANVIP
jgi:hypothetical protein